MPLRLITWLLEKREAASIWHDVTLANIEAARIAREVEALRISGWQASLVEEQLAQTHKETVRALRAQYRASEQRAWQDAIASYQATPAEEPICR